MNKDVNSKILDYIEKHLNEDMDVDKIAAISGYSKFHLERIFATENGCTIYKYIKSRRLTEAARQLIFSEQSITDIGFDAGYDSQQAFTLAFKKVYNITPKVYRDKNIFTPMMLNILTISQRNTSLCYNIKNYRKEVCAA
jgi:AraC-like DNA-binding protein